MATRPWDLARLHDNAVFWIASEQKAIIGFCVVTFCTVLYLPVQLSYGSERLLFRRLDTRQEPLRRGLDRRGAGMYKLENNFRWSSSSITRKFL